MAYGTAFPALAFSKRPAAMAGSVKGVVKMATAKKSVKKGKVSPKKAVPKKKQAIVGEGDYAASRSFLKEQSDFVKRNKDRIPILGKEAEKALEGPEGASLKAAERKAKNRSRG